MNTNLPFLSVLIFLPLVFALVVLALPKDNVKNIKMVAFGGTILTLLLSIAVWMVFGPHSGGTGPDAPYQMVERISWIPELHVNYLVGIDGISLLMVLMTTGIFPFVVGCPLAR